MKEGVSERGRVADPGAASAALPYRPSWFDRLVAGIKRLPGPAVLWYGLLAAGRAGLFTVLTWVDGTFPVGEVALHHLVFVGTPLYTLAVLHGLDHVAGQALDDFRPVLAADAATTVESSQASDPADTFLAHDYWYEIRPDRRITVYAGVEGQQGNRVQGMITVHTTSPDGGQQLRPPDYYRTPTRSGFVEIVEVAGK